MDLFKNVQNRVGEKTVNFAVFDVSFRPILSDLQTGTACVSYSLCCSTCPHATFTRSLLLQTKSVVGKSGTGQKGLKDRMMEDIDVHGRWCLRKNTDEGENWSNAHHLK